MEPDPTHPIPVDKVSRPLPAVLEQRTDTSARKAATLISAFKDYGGDKESYKAMANAVVEVLKNSDIELLKESNRAAEVLLRERNRAAEVLARHKEEMIRPDFRRQRRQETRDVRPQSEAARDVLARSELFAFRLRLYGLIVATILAIGSLGGAVWIMRYDSLLSLGFLALAAACSGAAFAIATGLTVKPQDFIDMLAAGSNLVDAKRDEEQKADNGSEI